MALVHYSWREVFSDILNAACRDRSSAYGFTVKLLYFMSRIPWLNSYNYHGCRQCNVISFDYRITLLLPATSVSQSTGYWRDKAVCPIGIQQAKI